jgi:two-component system response regulator FlrC
MAEDEVFRSDLLYRLRRLEVVLQPLRERPDDVLAIAEHLLAAGRRDGLRPVLSDALRRALREHPWPGNVRELRNVIERMRIMGSEALTYDLDSFRALAEDASPAPAPPPAPPSGPDPTTGDVARLLAQGRSPLRRRERLRGLFREHRRLTRLEVARILEVSRGTATRDLAALIEEGLVRKVTPTASPRTHYFELAGQAP